MTRRRTLFTGLAALAGIWLVAVAGIAIARSQTVTAEKTLDYLRAHSLTGQSDADRRATIEGLAKRVNQLTFEERQKFRYEHGIREFYESMTDAERARYLDLTLPRGMKQMIEAFNEMPRDKRRSLVQRAVNDIQRAQTEASREEMDQAFTDENVKKVIDQGLKAYLSEADATSKIDIQPLIEQMQKIMQGAR